MGVEHLWNVADWGGEGGIGVFGQKTCPTATLFTTNPTSSGLVSNQKIGGERLTSHGRAPEGLLGFP